MADRTSVLIALGGNIGDVTAHMQRALDALDANGQCAVVAVSPVYSTPPWGIVDQARFLNACAELSTTLAPHALLDTILRLERGAGRVRNTRWGPRTLDIDILAYGDRHVATERLTVPHPRMFDRAFVMVPLADIAADRMIGGQRVGRAAMRVDATGIHRTEHRLDVPNGAPTVG